jgi:segregation and condensation protein B
VAVEREQIKSVLESLLFVAEGPLPIRRLEEVLEGIERKEITDLLQELKAEYEATGRGMRLVEVAGGVQLRTASENAEWVKKLYRLKPQRMSRATLETLAIVAYRQPITRAEIEKVRGVDAGAVLTTLMDRRLIRVVARKDVPGRPFLYGTTPEFLEIFSLKDLSELPTLKEAQDFAQALPYTESVSEGGES